jgi:predicted transcriptional regulator YheO
MEKVMENIKENKEYSKENIEGIIKLSKRDKAILRAFEPIVEGIAKMFGSNCEVVLHSLEDLQHSIIKIENGHVTGRKVGFPLTDFAIEMLKDKSLLKSGSTDIYYNKTKDGKTLRSISIIIRNDEEKPIGFLCINLNLSSSLISLIKDFSLSSNMSINEPEHFVSSVQELINIATDKAISKINGEKDIPNSDKNKLIVFELYNKGIFNIKSAVDIVAQKIGVSRYTVYNYIREAKIKLSSG